MTNKKKAVGYNKQKQAELKVAQIKAGELAVVNQEGKLLVDSRQVAEMIGKPHNDLMKSIRQYCAYLTQGKISLSDFFIEYAYTDSTGRTLPCYLLTRKGCDMVANKLTGSKGILFTAAYVTKFEEMEKQLKAPYQIPQTFKEALLLAAEQSELIEQQAKEIEEKAEEINVLAPKTEGYNQLIDANGLYIIDQAGELMGMVSTGLAMAIPKEKAARLYTELLPSEFLHEICKRAHQDSKHRLYPPMPLGADSLNRYSG